MEHSVIEDLSTVIVFASLASLIFSVFRLPLMLGYLLVGFLIGPNFLYHGLISHQDTIQQIKELGVTFLMFYIGLEFDLRKLQKMFVPAISAVGLQTIAMLFVGMMSAPLLGWSSINGIFLGGLLAISSTMITIPILKAQGALQRNFAQITIGILILEDIIAIMLLVFLSGIGLTGHFKWTEISQVTFFIGIFVVMVYFIGKLLSPFVLKLLHKINNIEVTTLMAVGIMLGVGQLAEEFNFSTALGAFLAGSILSQSILAKEIEEAIEPMRNLFSAVFFVAIGMFIEPNLIVANWLPIIILTFFVIIGKIATCTIGLFLTGEKIQTSFRASVCKSQIGEFSFVIASLGQTLGVTNSSLMAVAVGVSLATIIIVPFLSNRVDNFLLFFGDRMPKSIVQIGQFYHNFLNTIFSEFSKSALLKLIRRPISQILAYFLIFNGVILLTSIAGNYINESYSEHIYVGLMQLGLWLLSGFICLTIVFAIIRNMDAILMLISEAVFTKSVLREFVLGRMRNILNTFTLSLVVLLFSGLFLSAAAVYFPSGIGLSIFALLVGIVGFVFWRKIIRINSRLEYLFMESFNMRTQSLEDEKRKSLMREISEKYPWPVNVCSIHIKSGTLPCGKRIKDLQIREKTGTSILAISRDKYTFYDPGPDTPLFPGDNLILLGDTSENIIAQRLLTEPEAEEPEDDKANGFVIEKVCLKPSSPLAGETLAGANLRSKYGVNVVGIQRGDKKITSPKAEEILKPDDILLVIGSRASIEKIY